jgi:hypothetical protein
MHVVSAVIVFDGANLHVNMQMHAWVHGGIGEELLLGSRAGMQEMELYIL